ncbi:T9SS type A sorting domain-containing protein [Flavobacterium zepuense]|uniref:T9SS type A sorting domain-containing protein n=1 Tax=Flavobacterium zepuense TaxID=2593302 RepID=A0A552UXY6_9FLAO|nr:T9SS type A sorting domain-containing protein [Flavobacterium zepuense]TRW23097.1 T9SS type A sorting domain-containing protein [Flavobacterium zepuense]
MKKITLLIALMFFVVTGSYAQASAYGFAQSSGTYVPITGGTVITSTTNYAVTLDSYVSGQLTFTTPFTFGGTSYDKFYVTSNGIVSLGTTAPSEYQYRSLSNSTGTNVLFAPMNADLSANATGLSEIRWEKVGDENVIQFRNFRRWLKTESFNFQVRLNTVTGAIAFVYDGTPPYAASTDYQPQVGIKTAVGDYKALTVAAAGSWNTPTVVTSGISDSSVATFNGAVGFTSGLTYTFTTPPACAATPVAGTPGTSLVRYACTGATPAVITVTGATAALPGIVYQWEQSTNGTDWVNAVGGTGATTLSYTPAAFAGTNIQYRLKVACTNAGDAVYTVPVAVNNQIAPATQATAATVTAANTFATSFNLSWTNGNGERRLVVVSASPITDPVNTTGQTVTANALFAGSGQQVVYDGTGTSVLVRGLACNTPYYVKVYEYNRCGAGPYDYYYNTATGTNAITVTTAQLPTAVALPLTNNFTGFTGSNLATAVPGWYEANIPTASGTAPGLTYPAGNTSDWVSSTVLGGTTAKFNLYFDTGNAWIISPKINITANSRLKFKAAITEFAGGGVDPERMIGTDDKVRVMVSTDGCGAIWTPIYTFDASNTATLTNVLTDYTLALDAYVGQTIQIAFQAVDGPVNDTPDYDFHIGNILVQLTPDCDIPVVQAATNVTKNSATLSWIAPTVGTPTGYEYVVSTTNATPVAAGTPVTATTANVASLQPSTTYYVFARTNCGLQGYSEWTVATTFTTLCDYPDITATAAASICGTGSVTLGATSTGTLRWFAAQTGGQPLATGATFATPQISATTTYYAEASTLGATVSAGKPAPAATSTGSAVTNWGIVFNAVQTVNLESVSVYSTTAGTLNIKVMNAAMTTELFSTGNVAVAAGGTTTPTIIPLNFDVPAGTGYRLVIKASSGVNLIRDTSGVTYPYAGSDGALSVVSSEWGGTTTSSYYYFYDVKYKSLCAGPRQAVVATVTTATPITASASVSAVCAGGPATLTAASANANYVYVWTPGNLTGVEQTVNPTVTTTYTVTATDAGTGCVAIQTVTVNVNPLPAAVTITPAAPAVCANNIQTLVATGGTTPGNATIGTATTLTGDTEQPTAFCNRWPNYWMQTIYTAAELNAAGLTAGNITSMAFEVATLGSAATNANYTVKIGTTALSSFANATYLATTGYTTVYGPQTYTHTASGWQVITFATPYVWDGVSNIVINITHDGADSTNNTQTYYTATAQNTVIWKYSYTGTTTEGTASPKRLNVKFTSVVPSAITWSPATNLYTDAAATTAYTAGANTGTVYFKSATAGAVTYTATATSASSCTSAGTVTVTVNLTEAPAADATQTFCNAATVANLTTTGGTAVQWYAAATGGSALATTTALTDDAVYYASQTLNGCESAVRTAVTAQITVTAAPVATATQTFCNAATVANLMATGTAVQWYAAATGGTALTAETALVDDTVYYVSQTIAGCESARTAVTAQINVTAAPVAQDQLFCTAATVANLTATGTGIQWYAAATGGTALTADTAIVNGTTYYASQTIDTCESLTRAAVVVTLTTTVADAPENVAECGSYTLPALSAGNSYYTATGGTGTMITVGTVIEQTTILYVYAQSGTTPNCTDENSFTITITIVEADAPANVTECDEYVLPALANGNYFTATGGTGAQLEAGDLIDATTTLYVYATSGTCTDENTFTVTINSAAAVQGEATQTVTVNNANEATLEDIVVTATGTVIWYASEADALAGTNPLAADTMLTAGTTYYAVQTIGNCTSTEVLAVTIDVVLSKEGFDVKAFTYYPNPVNNVLNISYSSDITSVSVFNLLGQQVITTQPNATDAKVDMSALSEGTYMVNVTAGSFVKTIKVVKKH